MAQNGHEDQYAWTRGGKPCQYHNLSDNLLKLQWSYRCLAFLAPWVSLPLSSKTKQAKRLSDTVARTLDDLVYFTKSLIGMRCWQWDHSVHPIDWREAAFADMNRKKKYTVGLMRTDGGTSPHLLLW